MMRSYLLIVNLMIFALLIGCNKFPQEANEAHYREGYIFEVEKNSVLVLDHLPEEYQGKTWNDIRDTYKGEALWIKTERELVVGQKIRYWLDGEIATSNPGKAKAKKIEVLQNGDM